MSDAQHPPVRLKATQYLGQALLFALFFAPIAYITQLMTLEPGDVILTGTPAGVSPLHAGDEVTVEIERVGTLTNPVISVE